MCGHLQHPRSNEVAANALDSLLRIKSINLKACLDCIDMDMAGKNCALVEILPTLATMLSSLTVSSAAVFSVQS